MMKLKYRLVLFCLVLFSIHSWSQGDNELIKAVKAKLDKVKDYQAKGTMNIDVSFIKAPSSAITVFYKNPDQFKIQKRDGLSIFPKGGVSMNMGALLNNSNYTAVEAGEAIVRGVTTKVIKLLPLDEASDIVLTTLYIEMKNALVRKASVTTKENGSYEVEMDYGKYAGWGLPDKVSFVFNTKDYKLPKGLTFEYDKGEARNKQEAMKNKKGRVDVVYAEYIINKGISDAIFKSKS